GTTQPVYHAAFLAYLQQVNASFSVPLMIPIQLAGNSSNAFPAPIALAISGAVGETTLASGMPVVYDLTNNLHITDNTQGGTLAKRCWAVLKSELFGGTSGNG